MGSVGAAAHAGGLNHPVTIARQGAEDGFETPVDRLGHRGATLAGLALRATTDSARRNPYPLVASKA